MASFHALNCLGTETKTLEKISAFHNPQSHLLINSKVNIEICGIIFEFKHKYIYYCHDVRTVVIQQEEKKVLSRILHQNKFAL